MPRPGRRSSVEAGTAKDADEEEPMPNDGSTRRWELIYVSDPSNVTNYDFDPGDGRPLITSHPATAEELRVFVDNIALSNADVLVQEVYHAGWIMYFRSERFEYDARPQHRRFLPMMDDGVMPLQVMLDRSRERGMRFMAGFRVNDNHGAPDQGGMFLHKNPQWKLTDVPPGGVFLPGNRMDFTFDEVRDYLFSVACEVVDRFDVDGILLVFRDGLYFPAPDGDRGPARERSPLMTGLIERLRAMLDEHGQARGRRLELGVLVPQTVEECHTLGLDLPAWIGAELIDSVAPMDSSFTDFNPAYEDFSALTADSPCRLVPGVQPYCSSREGFGPPATVENYRALAHTLYHEGADGMSIYNFQKHWGGFRSGKRGPETGYPMAFRHLRGMRGLERVADGVRHYTYRSMWGGYRGFSPSGMNTCGVIRDHKLVLPREPGQPSGSYRFRLYEQIERTASATLFVRAVGLGSADRIAFHLNGTAVPASQLRRIYHREGRPANGGRELPPHTTCVIDLTPDLVVAGDNELRLTLLFSGAVDVTAQPEGGGEAILIDEVDVTIVPA